MSVSSRKLIIILLSYSTICDKKRLNSKGVQLRISNLADLLKDDCG